MSDLKKTALATLLVSAYMMSCMVPRQVLSVCEPMECGYLLRCNIVSSSHSSATLGSCWLYSHTKGSPSSLETSSPGCSAGRPVAFPHYRGQFARFLRSDIILSEISQSGLAPSHLPICGLHVSRHFGEVFYII